jgi:hypothetical protein
MNWIDNLREVLISNIGYFERYGGSTTNPKWRELRELAMKNSQYICRFCGGKYVKYLMGVYVGETDTVDVCCKACYIITNLNYGFINGITLCVSDLTQLEIVRKTVDSVIATDEIPSIYEIDNNAKKVPLSIFEYISILKKYTNIRNNLPNEINKYKIFFKKDFDTTFIKKNYKRTTSMFINIENDEKNGNIGNDIDITKINNDKITQHKLSTNEINFFNKHFKSNDNIHKKMTTSIHFADVSISNYDLPIPFKFKIK